jgi:predicted peptidase
MRIQSAALATAALISVFVHQGYTALTLTNGQYNTRVFRSPSGLAADSLRYIIRPPVNYTPSVKERIIIHMHGVGPPQNPVSPSFPGEGWGPVSWYDTRYRSFILEPFCPLDQTCRDNTGWATGNHAMSAQPTHGLRMVMELVSYLQKELNLDSSRVYLIGASNGG